MDNFSGRQLLGRQGWVLELLVSSVVNLLSDFLNHAHWAAQDLEA